MLAALAILGLSSPLTALVIGSALSESEAVAAGESDRRDSAVRGTDVILLVFDELPLTSLLDERGQIDDRLYPSFASLAGTSTWYPNAVSPGNFTTYAVPALLTGRLAVESTPIAEVYPENLFGWLASSHRLRVREEGTRLCGNLCEVNRVQLRAILADVAIIAAHSAIPSDLAQRLPRIDQTLNDFAGLTGSSVVDHQEIHRSAVRHLRTDRSRTVREFVASLAEPGTHPTLNYLHVGLPHGPFSHLPSGRTHSTVEHLRGDDEIENSAGIEVRSGHEQAAVHLYHRHLLQLAFVDGLLGNVLAGLKRLERFDSSLVIVLSDHGRSFQVGEGQRNLTASNLADVLNVPLFVKYPGQVRGEVDSIPTSLIDVLPTIAQVIGQSLPWEVDGRPLQQPRAGRPRTVFEVFDGSEERSFAYADLIRQRTESIARKATLFGFEPVTRSLLRRSEHRSMIGIRAADHPSGRSDLVYEIDQALLLADVQLDSNFLPAEITGRIIDPGSETDEVALILNGRVVSIVPTYEVADSRLFAAMVAETFFEDGNNTLELAEVRKASDGQTLLARRHSGALGTSAPRVEHTGATLRLGDAEFPAPERSPESDVSVSHIYKEAGRYHFGGTARVRETGEPMERVVLLAEGRPFFWSSPNKRDRYQDPGSLYNNFDFVLPPALVTPHLGTEISVAAISREQRSVRGNVTAGARCSWGRLAQMGSNDFERDRVARCHLEE